MEDTDAQKFGPQMPPGKDPDAGLKQQLGDFLLSLVQAFLKTGYYTPDHQESERAKAGLYEAFQKLFAQRDEVSFLVKEDGEQKYILIEGLLPQSQSLNALMLKGMASMYTPRFVKFLERKDLASLTLKSAMTETEFVNFINVMSEPKFVDTREHSAKEQFAQTIREKGILNISYIFNEEVLSTSRHIPWRARLALTRLKKDLSTIPLYTDMDAEGMRHIKSQIIQDIARPIRNTDIVYPVLANSDLAETEELREAEIDHEIISVLSDKIVLGLSNMLVPEIGDSPQNPAVQRKVPELARLFTEALNAREIEERSAVLETYFNHALIPLEQLPQDLQQKIRINRVIEKFLKQSETTLEHFDGIDDPEVYLRVARSLLAIVPELLRRDQVEPVVKIVAHIAGHSAQGKAVSGQARAILKKIAEGPIGSMLKAQLLSAQRDRIRHFLPLMFELGQFFVPQLRAVLRESNDPMVLKETWSVLSQTDSPAMDMLLQELEGTETQTGVAVSLIRLLGEIDCSPWIDRATRSLTAFTRHQNAHLRQAAVESFFKIKGAAGEALYLAMLEDPDIGVQKQAVQSLARIQSEQALEIFLKMLKESETSPSEQSRRLEDRLLAALPFYTSTEIPELGGVEDFLLDTLDRRLASGGLGRLRKRKNPLSDKSVATICEGLGEVGTDKSIGVLQKLEKQEGKRWTRAAGEALRSIEKRGQEGAS